MGRRARYPPLITSKPQCSHRGSVVQVGGYKVLAGGVQYLTPHDLEAATLLVPLTAELTPFAFGKRYTVLAAPLQDMAGVPDGWGKFLGEVIEELERGETILAYCHAGHGRTGTFLASLIALLESREQTPDPIEAIRERHCRKAVETRDQAEAIFALRGEALPLYWETQFHF